MREGGHVIDQVGLIAEYTVSAEGTCNARQVGRMRLAQQAHREQFRPYVSRCEVHNLGRSSFKVTFYGSKRQELSATPQGEG